MVKKTTKKKVAKKTMKKQSLTAKQEKAVMKYVECCDKSGAYRFAYNTNNMKPETVNRKAKELFDNGKITARLKTLRSEHRGRHDVTVDGLMKELEGARELAMKKGNPGAAVSAIISKAKLHGVLMKEKSAPIRIDNLTGPLTNQGQKIILAMSKGELSPPDASSMLQALAAQVKIVEVDELARRVTKLEGK